MKLSKTLKLTLAAIAAVGLISTAQASSFSVSTDLTTLTPATPIASGTILNLASTTFNFALLSTINTTPGHLALDLLGSVTANGAGQITLCLMADGFTGTSPLSFGFVANSTDNPNGITLNDTLLINGMSQQTSTNTVTLSTAPPIAQGMSNTVTITPNSSPFTLEDCITITFGAGGGTVSFDKITGPGVPDSGTTASLLGIGLLALAGVAKFRAARVTA
jgi:hypothetical protein